MSFAVIPAIDLRAGQVVRLRQGDYAQQTSYRVEPLVLARDYAAAGAPWLHVVDLDGARDGALANLRVIRAIADGLMPVQAGGGVRSESDLERLFDAGVSRVVVGSVAVREPDTVCAWLARHGADRLCIALDTRRVGDVWRLPVDGWTRPGKPRSRNLPRAMPRPAPATCCALTSSATACSPARTSTCTGISHRASPRLP